MIIAFDIMRNTKRADIFIKKLIIFGINNVQRVPRTHFSSLQVSCRSDYCDENLCDLIKNSRNYYAYVTAGKI